MKHPEKSQNHTESIINLISCLKLYEFDQHFLEKSNETIEMIQNSTTTARRWVN